MSLNFDNINDILRVKYFIPYYCIYRNMIPQNLNSLLRLVVAKWTYAVWFHAFLKYLHKNMAVFFSKNCGEKKFVKIRFRPFYDEKKVLLTTSRG